MFTLRIPGGFLEVPWAVGNRIADLFQQWHVVERQAGYVLPRRLARATFYRARYMDAVRL